MGLTFSFTGTEELGRALEVAGRDAQAVAALALYDGAGVMADAVAASIASIRTAPFKYAKKGEKRLPSPEEKAALAQAPFGIAKFDKNGAEVETSVGFQDSGYVDVNFSHMSSSARTNYKAVSLKGHESNSASFLKVLGMGQGAQNQKPVGVIANAINSGTSFMAKQPFFRIAVSKASGSASAAISARGEQILNDILGD